MRGEPEAVPDDTYQRQIAFERFTRLVELPMLVLSAVFLGALVAPVIDTHLSGGGLQAIAVADTMIWAVFVVEYLNRLVPAPRRVHFVVHNIADLVVVAVPVLRPLRLARLARLARFARVGALPSGVARRSRTRLHLDIAIQVTVVAVTIVGAVSVLDVERNAPGSTIHSFGDALRWALTPITTVGYGDKYPVTTQGRLIPAAIMLTGIAVLARSPPRWPAGSWRTFSPSSETRPPKRTEPTGSKPNSTNS